MLINIKKHIFLILIIFIQLFSISCKDNNQLLLEAAIDEFEYIKYREPLNLDRLEMLKLKFEKLKDNNVTALYYLSEITTLQNKLQEAYGFILAAYKLSHADSIYKQKEKLENMMPIDELLITDSYSKEVLWVNDDMLILKTNESTLVPSKKNHKENDDEVVSDDNEEKTITTLMMTGRTDIQKLYNDKQYLSAINNTKMLIQLIKDLKPEKDIKKELSQLYQDLAILYAKENKIEEANNAIDKAIELNSTKENTDIKILINKN